MNCLEYVLDNITPKQGEILKNVLVNKAFFRGKSSLKKGGKIIFTNGFHVGFGIIDEYYNVITDECSDDVVLSRELSLYDERLKIAIVDPKLKKGSKVYGEIS